MNVPQGKFFRFQTRLVNSHADSASQARFGNPPMHPTMKKMTHFRMFWGAFSPFFAPNSAVRGRFFCVLATFFLAGCGEFWRNQTASLGGALAGTRGTIRVVFLNNTPHRAVFTYGTLDQLDSDSRPDFAQFLRDEAPMLNGDGTSAIVTLDCGRVFSIGSPQLLRSIEENLPNAPLSQDALVSGVEFVELAEDGGEPATRGTAPAFEALLGVDFPCNSLLVLRFEFDDLNPGQFRTDFEVLISQSER
jgi:hypothetical protein